MLRAGVFLAGCGCIVAAAALVAIPLGLVVAGAMLTVGAVMAERGVKEPSK